jgi:hypothetical protein
MRNFTIWVTEMGKMAIALKCMVLERIIAADVRLGNTSSGCLPPTWNAKRPLQRFADSNNTLINLSSDRSLSSFVKRR